MYDNVIHGYTTPALRMPNKPSSENAMERLAEEADYVDKLAEMEDMVHRVAAMAQAGAFKHVRVNMRGVDGNAFNIMGVTINAMASAGVDPEYRKVYKSWAMSGDYENLLRVTALWVTVVDKPRHDVVRNPFERGDI